MYRDLLVWQKAMDLVEQVYRITSAYPRNEEFGLKTQMRRAAVSIPSNIAEGKARKRGKEFLQFLRTAMGSLFELETQLDISRRLTLVSVTDFDSTITACQEVGKMLNGLAASI